MWRLERWPAVAWQAQGAKKFVSQSVPILHEGFEQTAVILPIPPQILHGAVEGLVEGYGRSICKRVCQRQIGLNPFQTIIT